MLNVNFLLRAATVAAKDNVRVACKNNFKDKDKDKDNLRVAFKNNFTHLLITFPAPQHPYYYKYVQSWTRWHLNGCSGRAWTS